MEIIVLQPKPKRIQKRLPSFPKKESNFLRQKVKFC